MGPCRRNGFYVQNDYYDRIIDNPEKYVDKEDGIRDLYMAGNNHVDGYKAFDFLFVLSVITNKLQEFKDSMYLNGFYSDYIQDVEERSNYFIKAYASIFLDDELNETVFHNNKELIIKSLEKAGNYSYVARIIGLLNFTREKCSDETLQMVKDAIVNIVYDNSEDLSEEEINNKIQQYIDIIDNNQKVYVQKLSLESE